MSLSAEPNADNRVDLWTQVTVGGVKYLRLPLRTRWLNETDDLVLSLKECLELARPGDTVGMSETVTILLTGRTVDINTVQPGRLARFLARYVRPRGEHARGLSVPEKMQYVVRTVGLRRIIAATIGSAVTRPFGMHGTFYRIAGPIARDVDGGPHTPYEHVLLPRWTPRSLRASVPTSSGRWTSASALSTSTTSAARSARSLRDHCLPRRWQPCSATTRWANTSPARHSCWFDLPEENSDVDQPAGLETVHRWRRTTTSIASVSRRRSGARNAYKTPMNTASSTNPTDDINNSSLINPVPTTEPSRR